MPISEDQRDGLCVEVTLTHPAAAFAAMAALEGMSEEPVHADGVRVTVVVNERAGAVMEGGPGPRARAVMEAARRLRRAGVGADDIAVRRDVCLSPAGRPRERAAA